MATTTQGGTPANNPEDTENQGLSPENNPENDLLDEGLADDDVAAVEKELESQKKEEEKKDDGDDDEVEIPEKFKNEDGTLNLKAFAKSYTELEPIRNQNAEMAKELKALTEQAEIAKKQQEDLARAYGYDSVEEMQKAQKQLNINAQMAQFEANEYVQFLGLCEDPQEARDLLVLYAQKPSVELQKAIDEMFPAEAHRKVAESMVNFKSVLKQQDDAIRYQEESQKARTYLETVTEKHADMFKNQEFVSLFGEAFKALGTNLDTDLFVEKINNLVNSRINEYIQNQATENENKTATSAIEGLTPSGKKAEKSVPNIDITQASQEELDKAVSEFI